MEEIALPPRTLVVGDIHGALRALHQVLERAGYRPGIDRLIQTGDIVDGWPDSYELVEYLMTLPNAIFVFGNHCQWCSLWLRRGVVDRSWWAHGGRATIESYQRNGATDPLERRRHARFFSEQKPYFVDEKNNLYVHAGFDPEYPIEEQENDANLCWGREFWTDKMDAPMYRQVFIGHTPTISQGSDLPLRQGNVWNLDQGAAFNGKLTVMCADTNQFWQSDVVQTLYPGVKGR